VLRQITKMPSRDFRLWEVDLKKEERKHDDNDSDMGFEDVEDFDNFVIVEKVDVKKYNKQSKLIEEEKIKDSGSSKCLVAKLGLDNGHKVTLEDFQIKKVIDKGSFGKVFLVVQKTTGQMYAMKRINKDILIDKN
jgi:hypothetical protein